MKRAFGTVVSPDQLSPELRHRGLIIMLSSTFLSWGGFFMIIPLMAVHYVDHLGWAAGSIGLILAVRQFSQQGLAIVFGSLADRIGPKPLMLLGNLVRFVGFASLAWADTFGTVMLAALCASLGGAMFESPNSAAIAALAPEASRQRTFALNGVISSIGTTAGTQLGALLIKQDFGMVSIAAGSAYLVNFLMILLFLPPVGVSVTSDAEPGGLRRVLDDRRFLAYIAILGGYWFAWVQFGLTITLAATDIAQNDAAVSWIYLVNFAVTLSLGYLLPRLLERWFRPLWMLIVGTFIMGLGLLAVGASGSIGAMLIAAGLFTLGNVIARPAHETVTASLANPRMRGAYFGVAFLALAIGGGLGNFVGGAIYDQGKGSALPWVVYASVAAATSIGMWLNRSRFDIHEERRQDPA